VADKRILFAKLLRAEIEDLAEDIKHIEDIVRKRFDCMEIGDYVYKENSALLERERVAIQEILSWLDERDTGAYADPCAIKGALDDFVLKRIREQEYPEAIAIFLKRKTEKALRYVDTECEDS
jgi:hypothetical protein